MQPLSTNEIRRSFLDFFKGKGHAEVASSSLIPSNDPTLQFTNSGMVQFKDVFTGADKREYTRATTAQKCVRAGGKHNDLENVGYTPRHHTFFEMMGNFSFGDYFKADAIAYAWELITQVWKMPVDRLAVTVFRGEDGIPADDEAAALWEKVGVPSNRIFRLGKADNYWQMGDTGPQGPCTEIHFFLGDDLEDALDATRVERSQGWMEIWNLVFMQFVREAKDGPLSKLPAPSVDTGAGLERLALVMQGRQSTYETDGFRSLIDFIASASKKEYGQNKDDDVSIRVIADHARATSFLIADGVQPSNVERGYVLRRIMRRAIRHGRRLGFDELFFHQACLKVVADMEHAYPELRRAAVLIEKVAMNEERAFRRTLDRGLRYLTQQLRETDGPELDSKFVAVLYDTYGFPIDLTRVIANEHDKNVDETAAQDAVKALQANSGAGGPINTDQAVDRIWYQVRDQVGATVFAGYDADEAVAEVVAVVAGKDLLSAAGEGTKVAVVLNTTPFYGESGGQVGDRGVLVWSGGKMLVSETKKPVGEVFVHWGEIVEGTLRVGQAVDAKVDAGLRNRTRKNHSATHLLHLALREVLGDHVQQKGSLVAPDRLRFDFSHFEPMTGEETSKVEARVNEMILANARTQTKEGSLQEAQAEGAMMLFGEKYGDQVRIVRIGGESVELCGGTHVHQSGDIGLFKITSETNLASGVRRIEAVTGLGALEWVQHQERLLRQAAWILKASPEQVSDRIEKLQKRAKDLERELEKAQTQAALGGQAEDTTEVLGGVTVLFKRADGTPKKSLRPLADQLRDKLGSGLVVLSAVEEGQASILVAATKDLAGKVNAGNLVKAATLAMGGSGGGKADFAQGGGPGEKLEAGLAAMRGQLVS